MTGKDTAKLGAAVAIIAVAIVLYIVRARAADADGDEANYYYCTKAKKIFTLKGEEIATKVRSGRRPAGRPADGDGPVVNGPGNIVTIALSPYTKDWTGIPAMRCPDCGEVFALETQNKKQNLCPKCKWNPATGRKDTGEDIPRPPGESADKEGEKP